MAKFNSGDILKILRKFNLANEDNVPRNIEELKKVQPDQFSEIFSFKFRKNAKFKYRNFAFDFKFNQR